MATQIFKIYYLHRLLLHLGSADVICGKKKIIESSVIFRGVIGLAPTPGVVIPCAIFHILFPLF